MRARLLLPFAALGVSCTLLVQFNDQAGGPGACDGALCGLDAGLDASTADSGRAADSGARPDSAPSIDSGDLACLAKANGYYCGDDGLSGYPGSPGDLVHCVGGSVAQAAACDGGCIHITDPFPDACNPCVGVPDGLYCGRDLAGFPASNADFLIHCQASKLTAQTACAHGCGSKGTSSACY